MAETRTARPHSLVPAHLLGNTEAHRDLARRPRITRADLAARSSRAGRLLLPRNRAPGEGRYTVYDYSSALDRPNRPWFLGQLAPTGIYEIDLIVAPTRS